MFHVHLVLGYRTAPDRAALDTFRDVLRRKRGEYDFGKGRRGSFDAGEPDRFSGKDAGRYISKYLRPDGVKASFVPLLEDVGKVTLRNPETGRAENLLRPVYVSPKLTRLTGITMGFLRFCRRAFMLFKVEHTREELLLMYRLVKRFGAFFDGYEVGRLPQPPPLPAPLLSPRPAPPLTLF